MKKITLFTNDAYEGYYDDLRQELLADGLDEYEADIHISHYMDDDRYDIADALTRLQYDINADILCVGDLGLWHGRAGGYRFFDKWQDILDIANGYITLYIENGCLRARDVHHDGVNYYSFYIIKRGGIALDNLVDDIYEGRHISAGRLYYCCRSLGKAILDRMKAGKWWE